VLLLNETHSGTKQAKQNSHLWIGVAFAVNQRAAVCRANTKARFATFVPAPLENFARNVRAYSALLGRVAKT